MYLTLEGLWDLEGLVRDPAVLLLILEGLS